MGSPVESFSPGANPIRSFGKWEIQVGIQISVHWQQGHWLRHQDEVRGAASDPSLPGVLSIGPLARVRANRCRPVQTGAGAGPDPRLALILTPGCGPSLGSIRSRNAGFADGPIETRSHPNSSGRSRAHDPSWTCIESGRDVVSPSVITSGVERVGSAAGGPGIAGVT